MLEGHSLATPLVSVSQSLLLTHYIMVVLKYLPVPLLYPFTGFNGFSLKNRPGIECLMFIAIVWLRIAVWSLNALKPFIEVNCFLVVCLCPHSLVLGFCKFAIMQNAVLVRQAAGAWVGRESLDYQEMRWWFDVNRPITDVET